MIGSFNGTVPTVIALGGCRQRLVLSILLLPFNFLVTSSTHMLNGHGQNGGRFLGFRVVMKSEFVLMDRGVTLFLFLDGLVLWHAGGVFKKVDFGSDQDRKVFFRTQGVFFPICMLVFSFRFFLFSLFSSGGGWAMEQVK